MRIERRRRWLVISDGRHDTTIRVDLPVCELRRELDRLAAKRWIGPAWARHIARRLGDLSARVLE